MRVEFVVKPQQDGWAIYRHVTKVSQFPTREHAVKAAENFARAQARRGETGVVKVLERGRVEEERSFAPEAFLSWDR